MSAYDDAVAYLDAEVHPRCDYEIYSDMRNIVDEMEAENDKLRELIRAMWFLLCVTGNDDLVAEVGKNGETMWTVDATAIAEKMRELGIEVD